MFQPNSFDPILRQKTELQKAVTEQRQLIDTAFEKVGMLECALVMTLSNALTMTTE